MLEHKDKKLGIYVHIPFCVQKCKYCDFTSFSGFNSEINEAYVKALSSDIAEHAEKLKGRTVDSIFFGGGTPTCLKTDLIAKVFQSIFDNYNVSNEAEITIECNPATVDKKGFGDLINIGVNRLSIGLQSVHSEELKLLGRIHSYEDFLKTYSSAQDVGFNNVNIDLMYGIPSQTEASFAETLSTVTKLVPEHISAYGLKIEPGTDFYFRCGELNLPDEESEYAMYKLADEFLTKCGYTHYEISNYAIKGKKSVHNLKYWSLDDYAGFGISAHSLINMTRYATTDSIRNYIDHFTSDHLVKYFDTEEILTEDDAVEEYVMMRLRLAEGLSNEEFRSRFFIDIPYRYIERMTPFIASGHIIKENDRYYFSSDGMYVSNFILSEILDLDK